MQTSVLKKICAIITASCFTVTIVSGNLYANINANPSQSQQQFFDLKNSERINSLFSNRYGKIVSFNNNLSDTVVINIQDLHCDYSVQKNISSIIEEILNKYEIKNIFVEGAIGNVDTSFLSSISSKYKHNILDMLLKEGKITGTEYYSAISDKSDLLKGVEQKDIYLKNINRLAKIINSKKEVSAYLSKISKEIDFLKSKHLQSKNKQFNELLKQEENKILSQEQFLNKLVAYAKDNNISLKNYKNLEIYLGLFNNFIDDKRVQKELIVLLNEIKKTLSHNEYNQFVKLTSNLKDVLKLQSFIENFCSIKNINLQNSYPNINKFFLFNEQSLKYNPIELVKEERKLIDVLRTYLSESQAELEISYLCDFEQFYKGYLTASLMATQWEYVKLGLDKFKELYAKYSISNDIIHLEKYSDELNSFYDVNTERNEIFISEMNLDKQMPKTADDKINNIEQVLSNSKKIVILVAGGYHTDGINETLNKNNITNITITPSVTNSVQESRINYEYLAQQQAMSVKQMIALKLLSNATNKEQMLTIIGSLLLNQKLDGVNINILVEQLNQIFDSNIKVSLQDNNKLEFLFTDGKKEIIDIDEDIAEVVKEQNETDLSSAPLVQVAGEKLKDIVNLLFNTTFNCGTGLFVPQMYQISKEVCLFMVENKLYLGNGAVWDIANSKYNAQKLDGVEPIVYEYMPDFMQKALESRQITNDLTKNNKKSRKFLTKLGALIVSILIIFNLTGCAIKDVDVDYVNNYKIETIYLSPQQQSFNENISEVLSKYYVGNGVYKSFLYTDTVPAFTNDKYTLMNLENLYDQALAALSYMQIGNVEKAAEILNAIDAKDFLSISNLETNIQKTGELVWVGIAAVQYKLLTGDTNVDNLIKRVDSYLEKNRARDERGYFYWGSNVGSFVSTEHYLDILAYFNLKTLLYSDSNSAESEKNKALLIEAAEFIYNNLYDSQAKTLGRGLDDDFQVLDVYSWGVQVLLSLEAVNPEIYHNSSLSNIDINVLLEHAENKFREDVEHNGQYYHNLYRWSYEKNSPISFEWTIQLAIAYKMAGQTIKAEEIMQDVYAYSNALGFEEHIPYSNKDGVYNYYYYGDGWKVWKIPALCTKAQEVQYKYSSFFLPLIRLDFQQNYFIGNNGDAERLYFMKYQGSNWRTYAASELVDILHAQTIEFDLDLLNDVPNACVQIQLLTSDPNSNQNLEGTSFGLYNKKYYFNSDGKLKIVLDMGDFLNIENYDANYPPEFVNTNLEYIKLIVIAGKTSFFETNLNSKNLDINVRNITITYADGSTKTYTLNGSSLFSESEGNIPSSILPATLDKINALISKGIFSIKQSLFEILNSETLKSFFNPMSFIDSHEKNSGAKILIIITTIAFFAGLGFVMLNSVPIFFALLDSMIFALFTNMSAHMVMDFRYLKSIGLEEAIALYGKENVKLTSSGTYISDKGSFKQIYVINDKPKNVKDFNFKSVPVKVKAENGKVIKCWIGNYKGAAILFADGAKYETIVKEFAKTRQFETIFANRTALKANVDVIEIDMNKPNSALRYSESGNIVVGANILKTGDVIDLQKEISLLNNKKIEAVTINQNIALYIDDAVETISSSQGFMDVINLYIKNENLGVDAKILFSNKYIDRVLELLEQEFGNKDLAQQKFTEMIKQLKDENKEIIVIFDEVSKNINLEQYQQYGIFSYIANNEYVDAITATKIQTKFVTNLNQISVFDGSLSIIKVSAFRNELEKASGIFTFLTSSLNLKEYMKERSIKFIKQVASNFDYNQIPNIDIDVVARMLNSETKFEDLSQYLTKTDSISMYYLGLSSDEERNVFISAILERILVANYIRKFDGSETCFGLKDKKMETILSAALIVKYNKDGNFDISGQISMDESLTTAQFELEFEKIVMDKVSTGFKNNLTEINDPQSIDDLIKLIPLYSDRNVELKTANVQVADIQNIKGILSAA